MLSKTWSVPSIDKDVIDALKFIFRFASENDEFFQEWIDETITYSVEHLDNSNY